MPRAAALLANPRPSKSAQTLGDVLGREYPSACSPPCRFLPIVVSTSAPRPATRSTCLHFHDAPPEQRNVHASDPLLESVRFSLNVPSRRRRSPQCSMGLCSARTKFVFPRGKRKTEVKQIPIRDLPTAL